MPAHESDGFAKIAGDLRRKELARMSPLGRDLFEQAADNQARENKETLRAMENGELRAALLVILDAVDYTAGNCRQTEMIGAILPQASIRLARQALKGKLSLEEKARAFLAGASHDHITGKMEPKP